MAEIEAGTTVRVRYGAFAGLSGTVISINERGVMVEVTRFGVTSPVPVRLSELEGDMELFEVLRDRIVKQQEDLTFDERLEFWVALAERAEGDPLEEHAAYEIHKQKVDEAAAGRTETLLSSFENEMGDLDDEELQVAFDEQADRWLAYHTTPRVRLVSKHRALARWDRARFAMAQAAFDSEYQTWRESRWSEAEHVRLLAAAENELAQRQPIVERRLREEWGFVLPDELCRLWVFFHSLQESERQVVDELGLALCGVMDLFEHPQSQPRDGLDVRLHYRYYADPPEMLTFLSGDSDGLHYGLFFDDGKHSSGVVSYYNNDDSSPGQPKGTPLEAVREQIEWSAFHLDNDRQAEFDLQLARQALMRFETADRREEGGEYLDCYVHGAGVLGPGRVYTLDRAGAEVGRSESINPWTNEQLAADRERIAAIFADDPVVQRWVDEARVLLDRGDPSEALRLGRDLHWLSVGEKHREDLACELLVAAYRALGRHSLADIAEVHRRHRDLASVSVLASD